MPNIGHFLRSLKEYLRTRAYRRRMLRNARYLLGIEAMQHQVYRYLADQDIKVRAQAKEIKALRERLYNSLLANAEAHQDLQDELGWRGPAARIQAIRSIRVRVYGHG